MRRTVLMGDPSHFSVKGGANPHTRTRFGTRRRVDRDIAIRQWHELKAVLEDLGVRVIVVPPIPEQPGLVYPANAGFLTEVDARKPITDKTFYLSNLLPTRAGERPHYERVLREAGFRIGEIDRQYRFEGEADFFPAGDFHLLTCGHLERQRFVPALRIPPWRRIYGFRTDERLIGVLGPMVLPRKTLRVRLVDEAHYHGDTVLCAFGPRRKHLLAWRGGIAPDSWNVLLDHLANAMIELSEDDAGVYAANAFTLTEPASDGGADESYLIMPAGVSERLKDQIRERGVTPITVNVSEFLAKGGGSVKCMIGDLGPVEEGEPS
jgi:N-dimethylarginine dimethylaminohydrolase